MESAELTTIPTVSGLVRLTGEENQRGRTFSQVVESLAKLDAEWIKLGHTCGRRCFVYCVGCAKRKLDVKLPSYKSQAFAYGPPSVNWLASYIGDQAEAQRVYDLMVARDRVSKGIAA